jgi:hypothetical protein
MTRLSPRTPPPVDPAIPLLALAVLDPFFVLRGALLAVALARLAVDPGPVPISFPGGRRGWSQNLGARR